MSRLVFTSRLIMFQSNKSRLIFVPVCTCVVHKRCHLSVVTTCSGMRDAVLTDDVSEFDFPQVSQKFLFWFFYTYINVKCKDLDQCLVNECCLRGEPVSWAQPRQLPANVDIVLCSQQSIIVVECMSSSVWSALADVVLFAVRRGGWVPQLQILWVLLYVADVFPHVAAVQCQVQYIQPRFGPFVWSRGSSSGAGCQSKGLLDYGGWSYAWVLGTSSSRQLSVHYLGDGCILTLF